MGALHSTEEPPPERPPASSTTEEAITTDAEAATPVEAGAISAAEADATAVDTKLQLGSSRSSYQRLPSEEGEIEALRADMRRKISAAKISAQEAVVSAQQTDLSALKGPRKERTSTATSADNPEKGPPLLQLCLGGGCIQETSAKLSDSIYFISLLRIISLLKATEPANAATEPTNARSRLAAAGWATLLFIAAMCQIILMVLILETSTSSTCSVEHQTGCRSGEYCSFSIAKGQCNDCSVILPNSTTCCPTLDTFCPSVDYRHNETFFSDDEAGSGDEAGIPTIKGGFSSLCRRSNQRQSKRGGCPHVCTMYKHCISTQESNEFRPRRCDFLVDSRMEPSGRTSSSSSSALCSGRAN